MKKPRVAFLVESREAFRSLTLAVGLLESFGIEADAAVAGRLASHDDLQSRLADVESSGSSLILAPDATMAARAEAATLLPVVTLEDGQIPAALHAARILALKYPDILRRLEAAATLRARKEAVDHATLRGEIHGGAARITHATAPPAGPPPPPRPRPPIRNTPEDEAEFRRIEAEFAAGAAARASAPPRPVPPLPPHPPRYSPAVQRIFAAAREVARDAGNDEVFPVHFFLALRGEGAAGARRALVAESPGAPALDAIIRARFPAPAAEPVGVFALSPAAESMLAAAKRLAREAGRDLLESRHLLLALLEDPDVAAALSESGADPDRVRSTLLGDAPADGPDDVRTGRDESSRSRTPQQPAPPPELDHDAIRRVREKLERNGLTGDPEARPHPPVATPSAEPPPEPVAVTIPDTEPDLVSCDPMNPSLDAVERAGDTLLGGGIVAFPTDSGYVLAADATNPGAVALLVALTARDAARPVGALIHSIRLVENLAREIPPAAGDLAERFWPGPLTLVFDRHPRTLRHLARDATIGLRIPDNYVALSILSMVGRPLAAVAPRRGGGDACAAAADVRELHPRGIALIVDGGSAGHRPRPTVVSVTGGTVRILREGAIPSSEFDPPAPGSSAPGAT